MNNNNFVCAITLTLGLISMGVQASENACFERAQTQNQLNECAFLSWKSSDVELNRLYQEMGDRLRGDEVARKSMVDAQRKWLMYRDSECAFQTLRTAGGTMQPMRKNICMAELTRNRVMDFQNLLSCAAGAGEQAINECAIPSPQPNSKLHHKSLDSHDSR